MSLPYFPFYVADYTVDTPHLSFEEHGVYLKLLCLCWTTPGCTIPQDPIWIQRRLGADAATYERIVAPLIEEFFKRRDGRVYSPRLLSIWQETDEKHKRRVEAGKKGGRPRKALENNDSVESNAKALPKQCPPYPEPEPDIRESADALSSPPKGGRAKRPAPERAEEFWDAYPRRNGKRAGKAEAMTEYARLIGLGIPEERLIAAARVYAQECERTDTFACDAVRWLKKRRWEDETADIIPLNPQASQQRKKGNERLSAFLDGALNPRGPGMAGGPGVHPPGVLLPRR